MVQWVGGFKKYKDLKGREIENSYLEFLRVSSERK